MSLAPNDGLSQSKPEASVGARALRRGAWMGILTRWHWISSALCLVGMLFFALTGITLNHAELFESQTPQTTQRSAQLPKLVLSALETPQNKASRQLPTALQEWLSSAWKLTVDPKAIEWGADEVFVDLKRPGVDASLSIDRHSGAIRYEAIDRGWVAYLNEIHRGRNAGPIWSAFITLFGIGCIVFSVTGLLILRAHARSRWTVWPITGLGLLIPSLLLLLCIH